MKKQLIILLKYSINKDDVQTRLIIFLVCNAQIIVEVFVYLFSNLVHGWHPRTAFNIYSLLLNEKKSVTICLERSYTIIKEAINH